MSLTAHGVADVLAYVDVRLGYRPTESLALAFLRDDKIGLVMRMDLADLADTVEQVVGIAARERAASVFLVAYTDDHDAAHAAFERITDALATCAIDPAFTITVSTDGYRTGRQTDPSPLAQIDESPVALRLAFEGHAPARSRAELLPGPAALPDQAAAVQAARAWRTQTGESASLGLAAWMLALGEMTSGPEVAGALGAALRIRAVRDAVLVSVVPGTSPETVQAVLTDSPDATGAATAAVAAIITPETAQVPGERAKRAIAVLADVIAHDPDHAPAWALWSFLRWWQGDGAAAGDGVARALQIDPNHRIAVLLSGALAAGMPPGWAAAERG